MPLILSNQFNTTPDIVGGFRQGEEDAFRAKARGLDLQQAQQGLETQQLQQQAMQQGLEQGAQGLQLGEQAIDAGGLGLQATQRQQSTDKDSAAAEAMISGAIQLKSITDPAEKLNYLNERLTQFEEAGLPTQGLNEAMNMARQGRWDELSSKTDELIALGRQYGIGAQKPSIQFGGQKTFKDDEGNLFFGTSKRNPQTGEVQSVLSSVDGSDIEPVGELEETGSYGLTAGEKVKQVGAESGASSRSSSQENLRQEFITSGVKAKSMIPDTEKLIKLNELISTGKTAGARKAFGDLFNITDPNLGEFNSKAGQLVLNQIKLLGANPTEGERAFLEDISPSLRQGSKVNKALLEDILKVQKRQVARAKWMARNPDRTVEEYLTLEDIEDFAPSGDLPKPRADGQDYDMEFDEKTGGFK